MEPRRGAPAAKKAPRLPINVAPGTYYYGTWRGRVPSYAHQRWWLETRPERANGQNTWIVFSNWDDYEHDLRTEPPREVRWWGLWPRTTEWSATDYVDRTRTPPWRTVYSMTGLADISVSA